MNSVFLTVFVPSFPISTQIPHAAAQKYLDLVVTTTINGNYYSKLILLFHKKTAGVLGVINMFRMSPA